MKFAARMASRRNHGNGARMPCLPVVLAAFMAFATSSARADVVSASFQSPADIAVTAATYDASGHTLDLTLGFAPPVGTALRVVEVTALEFIAGKFSNLAQGQFLDLSYNETSYRFVANYYGGSGNDLVLQWAFQRPVAWGIYSQLGTGETTGASVPVPVDHAGALAGKTVLALSAGYVHSLVLRADGTVAAWGSNGSGQLGNNSTASGSVPVPVDRSGVLGGRKVAAVSAGVSHSLALCSDGTVAAWGENRSGQLGNNSTTDSRVPVMVDRSGLLAGKTVVAVSAGDDFSLALCADGSLVAWGENDSGQLGNNSTTDSIVPVPVDRLGVLAGRTVVSISAGWNHSLVLCLDGTLVSWGENRSGQLGNNSTTVSRVPIQVAGAGVLAGKSVAAISAGYQHSAALCSDGTLAAWGSNSSGQLGNNSTVSSNGPVLVDRSGVLAGRTAVFVSAGYQLSSALCSDGTVVAWGENLWGQLGNNSSTDSRVPVLVDRSGRPGDGFFVATEGGGSHSLGIVATQPPRMHVEFPEDTPLTYGGVVDFGDTILSNVRNLRRIRFVNTGSFPFTLTSVRIEGVHAADFRLLAPVPGYVESFSAVTLSVEFDPTGAGTRNATLFLDSSDPVSPDPYEIGLTGVAGDATTLAAAYTSGTEVPLRTRSLDATGYALSFSLGFAPTPGTVLKVVEITELGFLTGEFSNLAQGQFLDLSYNGTSYRFVANYYGGSGNDLVLQWAHQRPVAWGSNYYGQLGTGGTTSANLPVPVDYSGVLAGKTVLAVSAGDHHSVALCSDGILASWGNNSWGRLGNNRTTSSSVPVLVDQSGVLAGRKVIAVAVGGSFNLVLCSDCAVAAWGFNVGRLGNNGTLSSGVPVLVDRSGVLAGKTVVAVSAGGDHGLALCSDGSVATWGSNESGVLGNNSASSSSAPVLVSRSPASAFVQVGTGSSPGHALALLAALPPFPEIEVTDLSGDLAFDSDHRLVFESNTPWAVVTHSLRIRNAGSTALHVSEIAFTGDSAADFTIVSPPATTLLPGDMSDIEVRFTPRAVGTRTASMSILTTDPFESIYPVLLTGYTSLSAAFITGLEFPVDTDTFDPEGNRVEFVLNFAPETGQDLTVINQQGLSLLDGRFRNLAHGEVVSLAFEGRHYEFVANYHGGTGNDLVLQWARTRLYAWGLNGHGQLGTGNLTPATDPVEVSGNGRFDGGVIFPVVAGLRHTLALLPDGGIAAWGNNTVGQLGDGTLSQSLFPVSVVSTGHFAGRTVIALAAGDLHSIALCSDGSVATWGSNTAKQLGSPLTANRTSPGPASSGYPGSVAIAAGALHTLALNSDGRVWAWGSNSWGQLGRGTFSSNDSYAASVSTAGVLSLPRTVTGISAGSDHCIALCSDGTLATWGRGNFGQLGRGSSASSNVPVEVERTGVLAGKTPVDVAAGGQHCLALCSDGTLVSWGSNSHGQLGNGSGAAQSNVPVLVDVSGILSGKQIVAIAAGAKHSIAQCADGTITLWGDNSLGQLGGSAAASSNVPVTVNTGLLPLGARFVDAVTGNGADHTMALLALPFEGPGILVAKAGGAPLADGVSRVDFGNVSEGGNAALSFTITNSGTAPLSGIGVSFTGNGAAAYTLAAAPPDTIAPGESAGFSVAFTPASPGETNAELHLASNVGGTLSPFTFSLTGRIVGALQDWRFTHFGTTANAGAAANIADANGDGEMNLIEFGTGQSPLTEGTLPPTVILVPEGIAFTYTRSIAAMTSVSFQVEWSDDLVADSWDTEDVTESILTDDGVLQTVRALVPFGIEGERFVHLRVSEIAGP